MSYHILKHDLPKEHNRGKLIEIPEEESSYLIKGKGYFIQIFRDSDLLYPCYPQYFFTPETLKPDTSSDGYNKPSFMKEPFLKWKNLYSLMTLEECEKAELPYGTYKSPHKILNGYIHYDWLSQQSGMISIDTFEEKNIKSGDFIVRIYADGRRVKGIALSNRDYINYDGPFNRFCCIENLYSHGVTQEVYGTGVNNSFFYQKMTEEELTVQDIDYINNLIIMKNGTESPLKIDLDKLKIVKDTKE